MTSLRFTFRTAVLMTAILVVLLGGGAATAAWAKLGTGVGAVAAASLTAPNPSAAKSGTSPTTSIVVTWTATPSIPGVSYVVARGATTLSGCSNTSCTDTGLSPGTQYSYTVTTTLQGWTKAGTVSAATDQAIAPGMTPVPASGTAFGNNGWKNSTAACDPQAGTQASSRLCIAPVSNGVAINTANGLVTYRLERLTGLNGTTEACYTASATSGSPGSWTSGSTCSIENAMTYNVASSQFRSLQIPQSDVVVTGTRYYKWTVTGLRDTNGTVAPAQSFTFNAG